MAHLIGQSLGQYKIIALLGQGGMATVYRAHQESIGRDVAIKVIKPELSGAKDFIARFEREARTIAALSHPYILKVFDYGRQDDMAYLVMELLKGGSLVDLIEKGPLSNERVLKIVEQISSALDYAHSQGIIHRDLKPQNVLLDDQGNAHLTDFGIAKILSATVLTQTGTAMGTPAYMSPEQWQGQALDSRSDIYALGVMLFEMLTGKLPFSAETPFGLMHKHIYEPPPPIRTIRPDLPSAIDHVLRKALAKNREERYSNAEDLAKEFRMALSDTVPSTITPASEEMTATAIEIPAVKAAIKAASKGDQTMPFEAISPPAAPSKSRTPLVAIGAGIAVVIIGGLLLIFLNSGKNNNIAALPTSTPSSTAVPLIVSLSPVATTESPTDTPSTTPTPPLDQTMTAAALQAISVAQTASAAVSPTFTDTATSAPSDTPSLTPSVPPTSTTIPSPTLTLTLIPTLAPTVIPTATAIPVTATPVPHPVGKIAFGSKRQGHYHLYTLQVDQSGSDHLLLPSNTDDFGAAWSPDGQRLAFTSNRTGHSEIFSVSAEGTDLHQLTHFGTQSYAPAWSPDGKTIVFHTQVGNNYKLYIANADGSNPKMLSDPTTTDDDTDATWSPDGTRLMFHSKRGNSHGIYVMNMSDPSNVTRLTPPNISALDPAWSPDGKTIVFSLYVNKTPSLYLMSADGSNIHPLIKGEKDDDQASWDPSSQFIMFRGHHNNQFGIYIVDINGQNVQLLTNTGDDNEFPTWQPGVG